MGEEKTVLSGTTTNCLPSSGVQESTPAIPLLVQMLCTRIEGNDTTSQIMARNNDASPYIDLLISTITLISVKSKSPFVYMPASSTAFMPTNLSFQKL
jgi:hypothetical protein